MIGKTILHYKITEKLGEGGMGVVYLAEDTKLKRQVAVKFLPRHIATNSEERERFEIEAQAAAALNHPNIATIFNIEEADDEMFIVMEYIEGQELKEIIKSEIPNLQSAIDYATQIAKGLQVAHKKGIVHRDIKSANIMVTDEGQVKIMDFGLAKVRGGALVTKVGTTLGTAAYMSPEQARGEEADHRSDIWSFGVVLYQMLTGKLPFGGDYEQAVIYAILNEEPQPAVPEILQHVVAKTLAKNQDERYQKISVLLDDLIAIQDQPKGNKSKHASIRQPKLLRKPIYFYAGIAIVIVLITLLVFFFFPKQKQERTINSLAVLPFSNTNPNPETDFLGIALADEIIGGLAYLKSITVRASSSIRKYEKQIADPVTAGNDLKVDYVLTGNYLKQANDMRLNIELVNVHTNEMIWRESVEVEYQDAFKLQDMVSENVVNGLQIQFSQDERDRMRTDIPKNPLAYEYYLRGLSYPATVEGDKLAIAMIKKSVQLDSTYAPALAELGYRHNRLAEWSFNAAAHSIESEKAFLKALSLNDELLSAHVGLANLYTDIGKTEKAVELIRKALKINPNDALSHFNLSYTYRYAGLLKESEQEIEKALALDPKNPRFRSGGVTYLYLGNYKKALQIFELDEESAWSLYLTGEVLFRMGEKESSVVYLDRVIKMKGEELSVLEASGLKAIIGNDPEKAVQFLKEFEKSNPQDGETWYAIAQKYGAAGAVEASVRALRKTVELGFFNYPFMLKDSFLDSVRDHPEFQRVLALAKEKYEAFKNKYFPEN